jgi:hypothetical protein
MRITESQLRRIIRQEVRSLREAPLHYPGSVRLVPVNQALGQGQSVLVNLDGALVVQHPDMEEVVGYIGEMPTIDGLRLDASGSPRDAVYAADLPPDGTQGVVYDPGSGVIAHRKISNALGGKRVSAQRTSIR